MKALTAVEQATSRIEVRGWRRALVWRSEDVSSESARASCMVLAAHPDDETIGCGAMIARKRAAGTKVTIVIATDGRYSTRSRRVTEVELAAIRAEEAVCAAEVLGVARDDVVFLPFDDLSLVLSVPTLVDELTEVVERIGVPDEVFVTSARDGHTDHVSLHEAAQHLRPVLGDRCRVFEYPTWYWYAGPGRSGAAGALRREWRTLRRLVRNVRTTHAVRVTTGGHLAAKRRALACYASQTTRVTGEATWQVLPPDFLPCFLGRAEVFFPLR